MEVARVVHVLGASVWVGGTVFLVSVGVPYARSLGPERSTQVASAIGRRFRPVAWTALASLVGSGLYMMVRLGLASAGTPDGRLLRVKIVLVALLIVLSALHDFVLGPRAQASGTPNGALRTLARVNGALTLAVPIIGVLIAH